MASLHRDTPTNCKHPVTIITKEVRNTLLELLENVTWVSLWALEAASMRSLYRSQQNSFIN